MYVPKYAELHDAAALHEFVAAHSFGTLITAAGGIEANHYPFLLDAEEGVLWAHVARTNPQADALPADFTAQLRRAIVGAKLKIVALEGKFKLSQNRDREDYDSVLRAFEARTDDNSRELSGYMRKTSPFRG